MKENLPEYFTPQLVEAARIVSLKKGEHLFRTGQPVSGIYFVLCGELKAVRHMIEESEAVMMRASAGEFFAESAIATDRYSCDGIAVKGSHVAFVSTAHIEAAMENSEFVRAFFLANAMNARRQCSRYERVRLRSARERVLHLLTCEKGPDGHFVWNAPLRELATELAIEPETLYRVLAELEKAGQIRRDKRKLQIVP
jgi:CRP-like cAMP-binding protein